MPAVFVTSLLLITIFFSGTVSAAKDINMKEVRGLAKFPVDQILETEAIEVLTLNHYWKSVHGRNKPLVVFFYSNNHIVTRRVTNVRYLFFSYVAFL